MIVILVNVAIGTELIGSALPPRGVGVAAVHVEGRGQQAKACDVASGALDVDISVDVVILHLARMTLEVPILKRGIQIN